MRLWGHHIETMIISDQQRQENYLEYLRLIQDDNYHDVRFDECSGGVSAIHREHIFDKQIGPLGYKRGQYEIDSVEVMRSNGHFILLETEYPKGEGIKSYDATLDGLSSEIKTVERFGRWSIRTKIQQAIRQGAECILLYFPKKNLYSRDRIEEAWKMYLDKCEKDNNQPQNISIIAIVEGREQVIIKPPR